MGIFNKVQKAKVKRTAFNLSHQKALTANLGKLIPVYLEEVVPGDKFEIKSEILVRLAPLITTIMHRIDVSLHFFFAPMRLLWTGWEDFITGETAGTVPQFTVATGYAESTLFDYITGVEGTFTGTDKKITSLPFRAYHLIWNEYYRDQNLQNEKDIHSGFESLAGNFRDCYHRSWQKDYFTSALPWAQKGNPVSMEGSVTYKGQSDIIDTAGVEGTGKLYFDKTNNELEMEVPSQWSASGRARIENIESIGVDINEFRTAYRLQRWLEKNARAGSRYTEHLLAHFGVRSKDARLQRPEYLGGGRNPIVISEVLKTSSTDGTSPQGEIAGHGISVGTGYVAKRFFTEHGYIMGILSITPKAAYYQGMRKMFLREINTDFYFPEFANLGEQEVKTGELYFTDSATDNNSTFGYQSRYAEYKYSYDQVHGEFKDTLEFWHLGRKFASKPVLNEDFITYEAEAGGLESRIFAAGRTSDPFWIQIYHNVKAVRPMPYYGTPTL
jgi:hypothetical protein